MNGKAHASVHAGGSHPSEWAALALRGVRRGLDRPPQAEDAAAWGLGLFTGRLSELSAPRAGAALTLLFRLVWEAQRRDEPVAWIGPAARTFYPPDAAAGGVDVEALVVVDVDGARRAARAADFLLRSGAFGLVVLDLGREARLPLAVQGRLGGLAKKHGAAAVCLTESHRRSVSLGALVAVRVEVARVPARPRAAGRFACEARVLKDKGRAGAGARVETFRGPAGLR